MVVDEEEEPDSIAQTHVSVERHNDSHFTSVEKNERDSKPLVTLTEQIVKPLQGSKNGPIASSTQSNTNQSPTQEKLWNDASEDKFDSQSASFDAEPAIISLPTASVNNDSSANTTTVRSRGEGDREVPDIEQHRINRLEIYETRTRFYIVGGALTNEFFRILKIDRTGPQQELNISEDGIIYNRKEVKQLLQTINSGNSPTGGLKLRCRASGLLGFIRFTKYYYMLIIKEKTRVAFLEGHFVNKVLQTDIVALTEDTGKDKGPEHSNEGESKFLTILRTMDMHKSFYYSSTYNVTHTYQHNAIWNRKQNIEPSYRINPSDLNSMFVWNKHLLEPAIRTLKYPLDWCIPVVHGFVDQASIDIFGRRVWITLIARRSRFFAGARFLKRGVNDLGYVANDVETEQIVFEMKNTVGDTKQQKDGSTPSCTSFVQHRGSIPLYWTQDNSGVSPKPGIELQFIDPYYTPAALHFDNLFERYGAPINVVNLVRARERNPRESKLLVEYQNAIAYLNQSLPLDKRIVYRAFDMAKALKMRDQDVFGSLETITDELIQRNGIFHNGAGLYNGPSLQNGVIRSNCIDCLDRTNACQFVIGKVVLGIQLNALGIIAGKKIRFESDASNILAHMYNDHGDILASQYGGSHLVNTTESYRKIKNWHSHSRDMLESFKRYYHNSFLDQQRQQGYNLFLGNYVYAEGQPKLWEMSTDYYLHHADPTSWADRDRRDYIKWFTPEFLETRTFPEQTERDQQSLTRSIPFNKDWWQEYYEPGRYTSFSSLLAYKINKTNAYLPKHELATDQNVDMSPFAVRKQHHDSERANNKHASSPAEEARHSISPLSATIAPHGSIGDITNLQRWLSGASSAEKSRPSSSNDLDRKNADIQNIVNDITSTPISTSFTPADKSMKHHWSTRQFYDNSLHPTVSDTELSEYKRYLSHPQKLSLAKSVEVLVDSQTAVFQEYLESLDHIGEASMDHGTIEGTIEYEKWLGVEDNPLTVLDDELEQKRYRAYRKWLRGKSRFKQSKVDPEYKAEL